MNKIDSYRSIKITLRSLGLFFFVLSFSFMTYGQTKPVIKTEADTTQIRIGEQINLKITVEADSAAHRPAVSATGRVIVESL